MNIYEFRKKIQQFEDIDLKLTNIKNSIENSVEHMYKSKELDICDFPIPYEKWSNEKQEEFDNEWDYINPDGIIDLYNELGYSISELYESKEIRMSVLADVPYYYFSFSDAWDKIKTMETVDFCYAIIILSKKINQSSKLHTYIVEPTNIALEKFGLSEINKLFKVKEKPYAFVAMWFDKSMQKARTSIKEATESFGFEARTIDNKEHNNQIVPEIFHEIHNSTFVIVDLTGHRGGVYYEAGYAQALNKEVIHTCRADQFKDLHFDISQKNTICWSNELELKEKIIKRIKATIIN